MTIFEKLQLARCALQKCNLKKSGKNDFAHCSYFELADFLPTVNEILAEHKLTPMITFKEGLATLKLQDQESETSIDFCCPLATANLKGCHEVQNLGASMTYIRRYLYVNMMEICEADALDSSKPTTNGGATSQPAQGVRMASSKQIGFIHKLADDLGKDNDWLHAQVLSYFPPKESTKDLTSDEASRLIDGLQKRLAEANTEGL